MNKQTELIEIRLQLTKETAQKLERLLELIEVDDISDECSAIVFKKETLLISEKNIFVASLENVVLKSKNKIHLNPKLSVANILYNLRNKVKGFLK